MNKLLRDGKLAYSKVGSRVIIRGRAIRNLLDDSGGDVMTSPPRDLETARRLAVELAICKARDGRGRPATVCALAASAHTQTGEVGDGRGPPPTVAARSLKAFHHYADGNPLRSLAKAAGIFLWYIERANGEWPFTVSPYEAALTNQVLVGVLLEAAPSRKPLRAWSASNISRQKAARSTGKVRRAIVGVFPMPAQNKPAAGKVKITFNEDDARRLVELVGDHVEAPMDFRIFADSKPAKARELNWFREGVRLPRRKYHGTIGEHMAALQRRNAQGNGIFYSVNQSDGVGVKNANIIAVRCIPLDLDNTAPPDIWEIEPHMLMQSSPDRHQALFMIEPSIDFALAQNVTRRMAVLYGGDPNVSDRARVFRMPGFMHMKAAPFLSRILDVNHFKRRHTLARLDRLLPPLPKRLAVVDNLGIGTIGVEQAELLFENLDVECLSGNAAFQRFAMALHSACNGDEEVAELFFAFCATGAGYGDDDTEARNRARWESFDASRDGGVGVGTLRRMCLEFRVPGLVCFKLFNSAQRDFSDV